MLGVAGPPELMQVTGQAAGRADHDAVGITQFVDCANQLPLAGQGFIADVVDTAHFSFPLIMQTLGLSAIIGLNLVARQKLA